MSNPQDQLDKDQRGPIAWMAGNSVAANLLMCVLLVGGLIMGSKIKQEVFPSFDLDIINVSVPYPGASPEEVEQGIVLALEEAARDLDGVEEITSASSEGVGSISIELTTGVEAQKIAQDLQNNIDRITSFPEEAEEPRLSVASRKRSVVNIMLYGDVEEHVLSAYGELVRERLESSPGITQVELTGVRPYEISIEIPQARLRQYNLTVSEVAAKIRNASLELPGGGIKTEGGEILLRMMERREFGPEFARLPIVELPDGTAVYLEDLATIRDGFADVDRFLTFDGLPAVEVVVFRLGKETPIALSDEAHAIVDELKLTLPEGLDLTVWNDRSDVYRQRAELLMRNASIGLVLVFILLSIFLESRLAFWVMLGIPISFLGAFLLLPAMGTSLNIISLFAFIISLGIVVDDAIIVGENIYEHHQRGLPFNVAARRGAQEIARPVCFSIITNIVAFMPMFFVPGFMGKIFKVIPAVVVLVFFISLIESLFILPAHLGHQRDRSYRGVRKWLHTKQQNFSLGFMNFIKNVHGPVLARTLHYRYIAFALGVAVLIMSIGFVRSGRMGFTLFPKVEADYAYASAVLPFGSSVNRTMEIRDQLVNTAKAIIAENGGGELAEGIRAKIGASSNRGGGGHTTAISVLLTEPKKRPISTAAFTDLWRKRIGQLPGLDSLSFQADRGGPGSGASLTVELSHPDIDILEKASSDLAQQLTEYPIAKDINDGFTPGKRQLDFTMRPEGSSLGLTARDVARQVRNAFYGAEVLRQQRARNEIKVMVRLPASEREAEYTLEELVIKTPSGSEAMLRDVVDVQKGRAYTTIQRRAGRRTVNVTADVTPRPKTGMILDNLKADGLPQLVEQYPGLTFSFEGREADRKESLASLGKGFMMAMLVVYVLLAIPFRSYFQPIIIMISIPFGLVGAMLGHLIMGYSLSILSMFGIVALSGVVVNDSLILIDYANTLHAQGQSRFEAILQAGIRRFRPILLTTLTTFFGLAPMILETSRQARFLIPMAISIGFGILFATFITLGLVPCLYLIFEDIGHGAKRVKAYLMS